MYQKGIIFAKKVTFIWSYHFFFVILREFCSIFITRQIKNILFSIAPRMISGLAIVLLLLVSSATYAQDIRNTRVETTEHVIAFRTNVLYDAFVVPNLGMEVYLGANFTLGFDWFGNWIFVDRLHLTWQGYGGYLTARYYFGQRASTHRFMGHHVGLYGSILTYDVELGGKGYQAAKPGFGGGVEYGYSLPIAEHWCFDFTVGVGYQGGEYKTYQPTNDGTGHYEWLATYRRNWIGPTKVEVSVKWLIGTVKKGGLK